MKRKITSALLCAVMAVSAFAMTSCGGKTDAPKEPEKQATDTENKDAEGKDQKAAEGEETPAEGEQAPAEGEQAESK